MAGVGNVTYTPSESYHPTHASELNNHETIAEIRRLFPELGTSPTNGWETARQVAHRFEVSLLAA